MNKLVNKLYVYLLGLFQRGRLHARVTEEAVLAKQQESLTAEQWALAIAIGLACGCGLTAEAKQELRSACQNPGFRTRLIAAIHALEIAHLLGLDPGK